MLDLLEAIMILAWGLSWPVNIYKSIKSKTAKGKSISFDFIIWFGYAVGIWRKFLEIHYGVQPDKLFCLAFIFYFLNIAFVTIDIIFWFRNRRLDKLAEEAAQKTYDIDEP